MRKAVAVRFIGRSIFVNGVWERAWCQLKITAGQARRQFSVRIECTTDEPRAKRRRVAVSKLASDKWRPENA